MSTQPLLWFGLWLAASCGADASGAADTDGPNRPHTGLQLSEGAEAACEHYFAAQYATSCASPAPPATELARTKPRFVSACLNQIAAPGSGMTPTAIEACASALDAIGCQWQHPPAACDFHGSLRAGAACNADMQCLSGHCRNVTAAAGPGGPVNSPIQCGTCAPAHREGEICGDSNDCTAGFECITSMTSAANPVYTCTRVVEGEGDAQCDGLTALCKPGLYCDGGRCRALHVKAGEACGASDAPNGCAPPLSCNDRKICAPPATEGESCSGGRLCADGLVCNPMQQCRAVSWAEPGAACDATTHCRINTCPRSFGPLGASTCPSISADGESCAGQFNCDAFSDCLDGVCVLRGSAVCR